MRKIQVESFLDGVFGVGVVPEEIPREAFHARAVKLVETFVGAQVAAAAGSRERRVLTLRIRAGDWPAGRLLGPLHPFLLIARCPGDSSPPGHCESYRTHVFPWVLHLGNRR